MKLIILHCLFNIIISFHTNNRKILIIKICIHKKKGIKREIFANNFISIIIWCNQFHHIFIIVKLNNLFKRLYSSMQLFNNLFSYFMMIMINYKFRNSMPKFSSITYQIFTSSTTNSYCKQSHLF